MTIIHPHILKLDIAGMPVEWLDWESAVGLYFTDKVSWEAGEERVTLYGGFADDGRRTTFSISTIIAVPEKRPLPVHGLVPPLTRRELYHRDSGLCMYCGTSLRYREMQFEHIVPRSRGGPHTWDNVTAACGPCNHRKAARTPEEAGMRLLALPFVPNRAQWLILANRRILADQQRFLETAFA